MAKLIQSDKRAEAAHSDLFACIQEMDSIEAVLADHREAVKGLREQIKALRLRASELANGQQVMDLGEEGKA